MDSATLSNTRVTWLLIGITYGTVLGIMLGRRWQTFSAEQAGLRSRVWELEARERERERAKEAKAPKAPAS